MPTRPASCVPRSSGRPPTSTASSRCSRRCCASPRSRPGRGAPRSRRWTSAPLLADVAELYGAVAEEKGIALTVQAPARLPAFGDRDLIQQAVANLVDNAVKFSPPGGAVMLSAARRRAQAWRSRWPIRVRASRKRTGRAPPNGSSAARRARNTPGLRPRPRAGAGGGAAARRQPAPEPTRRRGWSRSCRCRGTRSLPDGG